MPGDRKSSCGARMKPIGLTLKNIKTNPYTRRTSGEPMLVHLCLGCGKISCNRIAGDDNSYSITQLLELTTEISTNLDSRLRGQNIHLVSQKEKKLIYIAIYGYDYMKYLK